MVPETESNAELTPNGCALLIVAFGLAVFLMCMGLAVLR
jgi:hypothetical protein